MAGCEKCWGDAYLKSRNSHKSQAECYHDLIKERDKEGRVCTLKEQAGQFWDETLNRDTRYTEEEWNKLKEIKE